MKIQVINFTGNGYEDNPDIKVSVLDSPDSFDLNDVNIIDLNSEEIWKNRQSNMSTIDAEKDILTLMNIIKNSKSSKTVIQLPQNFKYQYGESHRYNTKLKDNITVIENITKALIGANQINIMFASTSTKISNMEVKSDFIIEKVENNTARNIFISKSIDGKITTTGGTRIFITTLDICKDCQMIEFLKHIGAIKSSKEPIPEWMKEVTMFDDKKQLQLIEKSEKTITDCNLKIDTSMNILTENNKYKSILYTQGDELVEVVSDILTEIFEVDLKGFVDKKKEDFLFKQNEITYIGEVKGINTNVKAGNLAQLDKHYHDYRDENKNESVKALLIINAQRTKKLSDREAVNDEQIKLAARNGSLIVETAVFVKMFEMYKLQTMSRDRCIELLRDKKGILLETDLN